MDESGQYFTLVYGILNLETYELTFISAGHPHSVLFSEESGAIPFDRAGLPIGFSEDEQYDERTIQLKPNDRFFVYSDGISEAVDEGRQQFGAKRFHDALGQNRRVPLKDCLDLAIEKVENWSGRRLFDDISVLAIEMTRRPK